MVDSLKTSDQQWAKNHLLLHETIKQLRLQKDRIVALEKHNNELQKEVNELKAHPTTSANPGTPEASELGFT
jgi:hypothetical protein